MTKKSTTKKPAKKRTSTRSTKKSTTKSSSSRKSPARRSSTRKTPARKRRTSASKKSQSSCLNQLAATIGIVGVLLFAGYYVMTGEDPLGLFGQNEEMSFSMSVGSGGDWWQTYFTDPQSGGEPSDLSGTIPGALIEHINGAQESIHIASFEFNLTPVADALIAAHARGVEVRWITDDEHGLESDEDEGHGQFALLERSGIEVKDDARAALMHNKFWIFDNQTLWTGSTNITSNGSFYNNNNVLVLDSPQVAAIYEREFDELWAGEFGPRSPSTLSEQSATIDGTSVRVLFAAEDEVAEQLVPLLENAESRIRFMAFSFTHDEIGAAVLARAAAGVDVKGIFETRGSETEYSEMPALYCAGVPVRQDGNPRTFHHKVFIVDDQMLITGSFNFSENADSSNDENVLIITHTDIAQQYLQEFERRWAEATAPDSADMNCP